MRRIRIRRESTLPPDEILSATIDFSDRRPKVWPNINPSAYRVHAVGGNWADVTEGSSSLGGIWARERYEWSQPGVVTARIQDSNVYSDGVWELTARPTSSGSVVEVVSDRSTKGLKGKLLGGMLTVFGTKILGDLLDQTLTFLENEARVAE